MVFTNWKAKLIGFAVACVFALMAAPALSAPVTCVNDTDDRYMTLDPDEGTALCDGSGSTPPAEGQVHSDLGFTEIAKLEGDGTDGPLTVSGIDGTSGTIELDLGLYDDFENIFIVFKFGSGGISPDWFRYSLDGVFTAAWEVFGTLPLQALSHVTLYGDERVTVPAPGTLGLLGLGLAALGFRLRRHLSS
jgi:hypothetical protein